MIVNCDCTDPQQVFNRLAQLQDETRTRLDQIDVLMDAQHKNDDEFSELVKVSRAYLEPLGYPAVNARSYELDYPSIRKEYTILMDENNTFVRPTIPTFTIEPLSPIKVDAILKTDGATESAFEMAIEKALEECELDREHPVSEPGIFFHVNDADTSEDD